MTTRLVLDGWSLIYRSFYSLPTTVVAPTGQAVNAVRGFLEMATRLIVDRRPDELVAVMDSDWRPGFRVEAYPAYKGDRRADPPELGPQFAILEEALDVTGVKRAESPGLEADDAIATLVSGTGPPDSAVIVTGDRDLLALVRDPTVRVLFTLRGVSKLKEFDEAAVEAKYGIPPVLYYDFAMLRGDPSDGLPGVPGVGQVRAADLLQRFGSIEGILANLDQLSAKQASAFEESREYLKAAEKVVPLVDDADVKMTDPPPADDAKVAELSERYNLGASAIRLAQAVRGDR